MKKIISIVVSLGLLVIIYYKIDFNKVIAVFSQSSPLILSLSLLMVIPLTMTTSWRLCRLMPKKMPLGFWEANRLTLMASVLNMVLPSKMGDVAKSAFMVQRGHLKASLAVSLVVFEKACDMASLLAWCAVGLVFYPDKNLLFWAMTAAVLGGFLFLSLLIGSKSIACLFFDNAARFSPKTVSQKVRSLQQSWNEMHVYFWESRGRLILMALVSLGIWFLHLLQIWLFTIALRTDVPFATSIALAPLALLAGLLPLTFAGIGTRDAALVYFFAPYMSAANGAAMGVLCTMRYILPALAGIPFMGGSLSHHPRSS